MNINFSLLARLHALNAAFSRDEFKDLALTAPVKSAPTPNFKDISLKDLAKKEDEDGKGGDTGEGGGGTMKGLRGKHDAHAKAVNSARRLGR